ncbi:MAG: helix-turn-helix transcriptional regulator [Syntrophomonadaceae bacterium]|nr:helix-turn-helix transcriptional regulator [Syntrophomonadaceae bacterium]
MIKLICRIIHGGEAMDQNIIKPRRLSALAFSLLFTYLLSFVFEGQVFYSLTDYFKISSSTFIFTAIVSHFVGLFCCGFFIKTPKAAKNAMLYAIGLSFVSSIPFFFSASFLWTVSFIVCALASGCAVAAWGCFLKSCTPKNERIKTCADVLIYSNILMIFINLIAIYRSPFIGLGLSMLALILAGFFTMLLPITGEQIAESSDTKAYLSLKEPMLFLILFVVIITINSGLMYQVFNPAFEHLTWLTSWYWAVPYIAALIIMRNLPGKVKRSFFLYVGMAMIMASFIAFMFLDRSATSYFVVDTLMLGACGIFDLFWWSIIGEMLEHTDHPVKIFGIGLSANVLGVLIGGLIGSAITSFNLPSANVAVIALTVVCITIAILPPLNNQLVRLLKSHTYLMAYSTMGEKQQKNIVSTAKVVDLLTDREQDVLRLILAGKTNKAIAAELFISENTVKTHVKNIYSKYNVSSRAEIISTLLKEQIPE